MHVIKIFSLALQMNNRYSDSQFQPEELPAKLFLHRSLTNSGVVFVKWEPLQKSDLQNKDDKSYLKSGKILIQ